MENDIIYMHGRSNIIPKLLVLHCQTLYAQAFIYLIDNTAIQSINATEIIVVFENTAAKRSHQITSFVTIAKKVSVMNRTKNT